MGDLEPPSFKRQRKIDHLAQSIQVLAMDDSVDGQGKSGRLRLPGESELLRLGAGIVADALGGLNLAILEAELHMIEARLRQHLQAIAIAENARGDEVAVEAGRAGMGHQRLQIAPHQRFAAGKVNLQNPERSRLVDHALPVRCRELVTGGAKLEGIGAVGALQGAAMGQFRQHGQGRLERLTAHRLMIPLSVKSATSWHTS